MSPSVGRVERFASIESTQLVVRDWLEAGEGEICVAVAERQTAGRGRLDRTWLAPAGTSLLLSLGVRPRRLPLARAWRVPAAATLAMREAALGLDGMEHVRVMAKWPNDLVGHDDGMWRKLAGVLSQVVPGDGGVSALIVGIGINVTWRRAEFPPTLAAGMTSLTELAGGATIDRDRLLDDFLARFVQLYERLGHGRFPGADWDAVQITTGADVSVAVGPDEVRGMGMPPDPETGALRLRDAGTGVIRAITIGEVVRCRVDSVDHGV